MLRLIQTRSRLKALHGILFDGGQSLPIAPGIFFIAGHHAQLNLQMYPSAATAQSSSRHQ